MKKYINLKHVACFARQNRHWKYSEGIARNGSQKAFTVVPNASLRGWMPLADGNFLAVTPKNKNNFQLTIIC